MRQVFEIPGRLDGLNESTGSNRTNRYVGAKSKRENEEAVMWAIKAAKLKPMKCPVHIHVTWIEGMKPGAKQFRPRDKDNIRHGMKYIQDALVNAGIIKNDGFYDVTPSDAYMLNRNNPRIIVELEEV